MVSGLRSRTAIAFSLAAALGVAGCKPDEALKNPALIGRGVQQPTPPAPASATPEDPAAQPGAIQIAATGSISGTILFRGKAPAATIDTSMDPACSPGGKSTLPTEQFVVHNGKLANVFIYVKSGPPQAMLAGNVTAQPAVLDQVHCQYVPHVVAIPAGGYVEFHNSDPTMHNIHTYPTQVGNEAIDLSEGPNGQPKTKQFLKPELMIPVRCNNHPWMSAFINVSPTPYFAISNADGRFDLRGLPAGDYVLGAVHEKMGEQTIKVTITSHGAATADVTFAN